MMEEYREVFEACKHALCMVGVKGKDGIDRLLGCILLLQEDLDRKKVDSIISTLNNISVGGMENLSLMFDVITVLEEVRDGTFDLSLLKKENEEVVVGDGG